MLSETSPPPQPAPALFLIEQVSKVYVMGEVEVLALGSVDLELYEGEFVVLHQAMAQADEGALTRFRRHSVGFVFQFYNPISSLTGRENVALITDIAPTRCRLSRRWG